MNIKSAFVIINVFTFLNSGFSPLYPQDANKSISAQSDSLNSQNIPSAKIDEYLTTGKNLYRQDKYNEAIETWQKVLALDPQNNQALRYIERAQEKIKEVQETKMGQQETAPSEKSTANTTTPETQAPSSTNIDELLNEGKNLYRLEKYNEAVNVWKKVLTIDTQNSQAQRYIERAEEKLKELKQTVAPDIKIETKIQEIPVVPGISTPELVPTAEQKPQLLSLKDCVQTALDNNLSLKAAKREIKLSKQKTKDAWRALFPAASIKWDEISGTTTGEDFRGREFYFEMQQPVYQGGRLVNTLRQARVNMMISRQNYQKIKNDITFEVEQAFHILAATKKKLSRTG